MKFLIIFFFSFITSFSLFAQESYHAYSVEHTSYNTATREAKVLLNRTMSACNIKIYRDKISITRNAYLPAKELAIVDVVDYDGMYIIYANEIINNKSIFTMLEISSTAIELKQKMPNNEVQTYTYYGKRL